MATKAALSYTNNMSANKKPLLTDLNTAFTSIQSYVNIEKDDQLQVTHDCFGTSYAYNGNATRNFTNMTLYNKLTSQSKYTGGNISLATTGAWTDVDTSNAKIQITPEYLAGDFWAQFQFNIRIVSSNATNEADLRFRLTDTSTNSDAIQCVKLISGVSGSDIVVPVSLGYQFSTWSAALKTVYLQYFLVTSTATTITALANTNSPIAMQVHKI